MSEIRITDVYTENNKLEIKFNVSNGLTKYFKELNFWVEYEECVETVPESILIIPFICNVLPIVWLTNSKLHVDNLDKDFFDCLDSIKAGYKRMYPNMCFKGQIEAKNVLPNIIPDKNKKGCFFSGGVDAWFTLINQINYNPELITIHGSADFIITDTTGWEIQKNRIKSIADKLSLKYNIISSNFYDFLDVWGELNILVKKSNDSYWHGFQHGIGLIGLVAPLAFIKGYKTLYIASSYTIKDSNTCASDPIIDNQVRFSGTNIVHDGYNYNRQAKVHSIADYMIKNKLSMPIQVCLHEQDGRNCGACEKCIRTALAFLAEGATPSMFGIPDNKELELKNIKFMTFQYRWSPIAITYYHYIHKRFIENEKNIPDCPYKTWMMSFDINSVFSIKSRVIRFLHHFKIERKYE